MPFGHRPAGLGPSGVATSAITSPGAAAAGSGRPRLSSKAPRTRAVHINSLLRVRGQVGWGLTPSLYVCQARTGNGSMRPGCDVRSQTAAAPPRLLNFVGAHHLGDDGRPAGDHAPAIGRPD